MNAKDFQKIGNIVDWYAALPAGFTDLESLLQARRQLAALSVTLAQYAGGKVQQAKQAVALRKIAFNKVRERERSSGSSVASAESVAEAEVEELRDNEAMLEGSSRAALLYVDAIRDVLNAMAGDVNHLMSEKKISNQNN